MIKMRYGNRRRKLIFIVVGIAMIIALILVPTGYENSIIYKEAIRCKVEVLTTDESNIYASGLIRSWEQICLLRILNGKFKGQKLQGVNMLSGSLESDKIYNVGDKALAVVFTIFLIIIAGANVFRAIFSFIVTVLTIWKILVPLYLKGCNPIPAGLLITALLTAMIIYFVYGVDIKTVSAVSGSMLGTITTCVLGIVFTNVLKYAEQ